MQQIFQQVGLVSIKKFAYDEREQPNRLSRPRLSRPAIHAASARDTHVHLDIQALCTGEEESDTYVFTRTGRGQEWTCHEVACGYVDARV